jgi:hypothetical protein
MSNNSNKIPPLITGALYEFRSKPTFSHDGIRQPDGHVRTIVQFVGQDDSNYFFIMKDITVDGLPVINLENNTSETPFSKEDISKKFFVLSYPPSGGKTKSRKRRHKKTRRKNKNN